MAGWQDVIRQPIERIDQPVNLRFQRADVGRGVLRFGREDLIDIFHDRSLLGIIYVSNWDLPNVVIVEMHSPNR